MLSTEQKLFTSGQVFTPSAPVSKKDLFAGRVEQLRNVINGINQVGRHVIIYGERGVGKTSLVNVIQEFLPSGQGILCVRVNCDASATYESLFRSILSEIKLTYERPGLGFNAETSTDVKSLNEFINKERGLNPNELRFLFRSLTQKVIIMIDEFDRASDSDLKRALADTLKNFSDYGIDTTFILVGVAESVEGLIAEHQSAERALVQVQMPRMSLAELSEIVDKGLKKLEMQIKQVEKDKMLKLSQGLPHYIHLLSLHAAQSAIEQERATITEGDVDIAISRSIDETEQSVRGGYYKAITSPQGARTMFPQVLLACALARNDDMGSFAASDIRKPLEKVTGKEFDISAFSRHLKEFCSDAHGPILKKTGSLRRYRYRFINPLMEPFLQ